MDLAEALRTTGAVRQFTPEPVPQETVARLLDLARFAPSGGNRQAWRVVLLSDPDLKTIEAFGSRRMKKFLGKSFLGIVRSTFLIGADGKLEHIWDPVTAKGHPAEVLAALSQK